MFRNFGMRKVIWRQVEEFFNRFGRRLGQEKAGLIIEEERKPRQQDSNEPGGEGTGQERREEYR